MAHSLDGAAAAVWLACESVGEREAIARIVASQGYEPLEIDDAIDSMVERELLESVGGFDRRTLLRRGLTATAAGAVLSIVLPDVAAAASAGSSLFTNTSGYSLTGTAGGPGTVDGSDYPQPTIENLVANFPEAQIGLYIYLSIVDNGSVPQISVPWDGTTSLSIDLAAEINLNFDPALGEGDEVAAIIANRDAWIAASSLRADFGALSEASLQWYGKAFGPTAS